MASPAFSAAFSPLLAELKDEAIEAGDNVRAKEIKEKMDALQKEKDEADKDETKVNKDGEVIKKDQPAN